MTKVCLLTGVCSMSALAMTLLCAAGYAEEPPAKTPAPVATTAESAPALKRPKLNPIFPDREDWSVLRGHDTSTTGDFFDPIKFIPLNDDGSIWLSLGGQVRERYEYWNNFNARAHNEDGFLLTRLRAHADLHIGENFRAFVEGKSAFATDRDLPGGQRTLDVDELALQQAWGEYKVPLGDGISLTLRGGRQELAFGKQRLVSPLDWSNTRRSWDGGQATLKVNDWSITGFYTLFDPVKKYNFNSSDDEEEFWGVYATGALPFGGIHSDLYYLGRNRPASPWGTDDERHTLGGRLFGDIADTGLDYDFEGAYQIGKVSSAGTNLDVSAFMIGSELGLKLPDLPGKPRFFVGFDYASGDDRSTDGTVHTFDQLYPLGHAYLGYIDMIGRQNIMDVSGGVKFSPIEKFNVYVAGHYFERAEDNDRVYNAGGGPVGTVATPGSSHIGTELDVVLNYAFDAHMTLTGGYSRFFAGKAFGPPRKDVDFFWLQWEYSF